MARDFDRQVAEFQVRVAALNGVTALGIPVTETVGYVRSGKGAGRPSPDLCNRARRWQKRQTEWPAKEATGCNRRLPANTRKYRLKFRLNC